MFGDNECPICTNVIPESERWFRPCPCGFRICIWCFHTMINVAAESETVKCARCPMCRTDYPDAETLLKQNPSNQTGGGGKNNNKKANSSSSQAQQQNNKRPPRRSHASKSNLAEVVVYDGRNVVIGGLPSELFTIYPTKVHSAVNNSSSSTSASNNNNNGGGSFSSFGNKNSNNSNSNNSDISLQELLCSHSWFGQYGRIVSCCVSEMHGGMAVLRYFNADDAANLVKAISSPSTSPGAVFVASIIEREKDEDDDQVNQSSTTHYDDENNTNASSKKKRTPGAPSNTRIKNTELDVVLSCGTNLVASIVPTRYCSSFLRNEECKKPFCVEVHHAPSGSGHHHPHHHHNHLHGHNAAIASSSSSVAPSSDLLAGEITVFGTPASMMNLMPTIVNFDEEQEELLRQQEKEKQKQKQIENAKKKASISAAASAITFVPAGGGVKQKEKEEGEENDENENADEKNNNNKGPIVRYFTNPDDWVANLMFEMKKNNPAYFATAPQVATANLQHRLKQSLKNAILTVSRNNNITTSTQQGGNNNNNKNFGSNNNNNNSSSYNSALPIVFPVLPLIGKEQ